MRDHLMRDIRRLLRSLSRSYGFTVVTVLTLGLGIGAVTLVYSVVHGVLIRPLPYREPDRLVNVWCDLQEEHQFLPAVHPADFRDYQTMATTFEGFAAASGSGQVGLTGVLTGDGPPAHVAISSVTREFFPLLGIDLVLGRHITAEEEAIGGPAVALISHRLWQGRFGSDPDILGRTLQLDGRPFEVIGVLPESFRLHLPSEAFLVQDADVWVPLQMDYTNLPPRNWTFFTVFGRLRDGVTLDQAQADMDRVAEELRAAHPTHIQSGMRIVLMPLQQDVVKQARSALLLLLGAVGFVLLIACANAAHLLLVRYLNRERDLAVQAALGADGRRLAIQTLRESLLLALGGAVLGVVLAYSGLQVIKAVQPPNLPRLEGITIDGAVLLFTLAAALFTTVVFGSGPVFRVLKVDLVVLLREGARSGTGRGARRFRDVVVVAEIGLSLVLLVGTGLMIRSFQNLRRIEPGFEPRNALTFSISLPVAEYDASSRIGFFSQLEDRLRTLPGVTAAGACSQLPLTGTVPLWPYALPGDDVVRSTLSADGRQATPGYFEALGVQLLAGRWFTPQDDRNVPLVSIVDELLARRLWPDSEAVGQILQLGFGNQPVQTTVVGVVAHPRAYDLSRDGRPQVYLPEPQLPGAVLWFVVRSTGDPLTLTEAVRSAVWDLDPDLPLQAVRPLQAYVDDAMAETRFLAGLLSAFGLLALLLAGIGTYGVMAYNVDLREREFAIRMALGSSPGGILRSVFKDGLRLLGTGTLVGLLAALLLARAITGLLHGVGPWDPLTYLVLLAVLALAMMVACLIPAHRASTEDPVIALKVE